MVMLTVFVLVCFLFILEPQKVHTQVTTMEKYSRYWIKQFCDWQTAHYFSGKKIMFESYDYSFISIWYAALFMAAADVKQTHSVLPGKESRVFFTHTISLLHRCWGRKEKWFTGPEWLLQGHTTQIFQFLRWCSPHTSLPLCGRI